MNKTYLGISIVAAMLIVYFVFNQTKIELTGLERAVSEPTIESPKGNLNLSEEELNENQQKRKVLEELMVADLASDQKRTLEISGWKKLSDEMRLDFISEQMEIWIPEEWFANGGIGSGRGAFVLLYQWPEGVEKTEENRSLLQGYYPELDVLKVEFLNLGSRVLSLNEDYLRNYTPYISYEDTVSEIMVSGVKAKKVVRLFLKTDRTEVTQYSLVFENLPQGFEFVDISISDETYTNAEEILDEIIKRIEIKE